MTCRDNECPIIGPRCSIARVFHGVPSRFPRGRASCRHLSVVAFRVTPHRPSRFGLSRSGLSRFGPPCLWPARPRSSGSRRSPGSWIRWRPAAGRCLLPRSVGDCCPGRCPSPESAQVPGLPNRAGSGDLASSGGRSWSGLRRRRARRLMLRVMIRTQCDRSGCDGNSGVRDVSSS